MKLKDYHELAMRTAKKMNNNMDQLTHGAMGVASEPGELALTAMNFLAGPGLDRANVLEELGDGMWFAAYCTDTIGMTLPELEPLTYARVAGPHEEVSKPEFATSVLRFCYLGGEIATQVKAYVFYGKALDKEKLAETLKAYIEAIVCIGALVGYGLGPILEFNIAKLRARYPGKYSDEAAIARADKESEALEVLLCCPTELAEAENNYVFVTSDPNVMKVDNGDRRYMSLHNVAYVKQCEEANKLMMQQLKESITKGDTVIGDTVIEKQLATQESEYDVASKGAPDTGIVDYN